MNVCSQSDYTTGSVLSCHGSWLFTEENIMIFDINCYNHCIIIFFFHKMDYSASIFRYSFPTWTSNKISNGKSQEINVSPPTQINNQLPFKLRFLLSSSYSTIIRGLPLSTYAILHAIFYLGPLPPFLHIRGDVKIHWLQLHYSAVS